MVFPVVMYGCESWTVKKIEHQRIDTFELWCWRRLLRVPWTERRSNQSILKEISPECSLEGLMLRLRVKQLLYGSLDSPLDCKEIQPVHSEGDQPWDFFGRNDAEAEIPVLWPPHAKS